MDGQVRRKAAILGRKLAEFGAMNLNETETRFPGTDLRLVFEWVSSQNPGDQEV